MIHFLPYLSLMLPEMIAPTDRSIRVMVIPQVTADGFSPKSSAISVAVNDTVKKSNAKVAVSIILLAVASHKQSTYSPKTMRPDQPRTCSYRSKFSLSSINLLIACIPDVPLMSIQLLENSPWILQRLPRRFERSDSVREVMQYLLGAVEPARGHVVLHLDGIATCCEQEMSKGMRQQRGK